jgi:hypothetical protein
VIKLAALLTVKKDRNSFIGIAIRGISKIIEFEFVIAGFDPDEPLQNVLASEHGCGHLLEQPDFINIYSVKKVIFRLQGQITLKELKFSRSNIIVTIPYNFISISYR